MKLVRDLIPDIIKKNDKTCKYHIAEYDEYETRLYEKMREELDEFIAIPSYEEAADMWEVFKAICELHDLDMREVELKADLKRKKNGGFSKRIVLEQVNEAG